MLPAHWLYLNRQIKERREERIAEFPVLDISQKDHLYLAKMAFSIVTLK